MVSRAGVMAWSPRRSLGGVTGGHLARKCEITGHWLRSPNCRPTWELTGNLGYNLAFFAIKLSLKLAREEATTLSCEG